MSVKHLSELLRLDQLCEAVPFRVSPMGKIELFKIMYIW